MKSPLVLDKKRQASYIIISSLCNMCVTQATAEADLVQLLVIGDGQQDVPRRDATLLIVSGCIACQLQDLS